MYTLHVDSTLEESRARLPVAAKELPAQPTADDHHAFHEDAKPGDKFVGSVDSEGESLPVSLTSTRHPNVKGFKASARGSARYCAVGGEA